MNFMVMLYPLKSPIVIITILVLIHIKCNIITYTQKIHLFLLFSPVSKNGSTSSARLDFLFPAGPNDFFWACCWR
jgi:hypothetical protein